MDAEPKPRLHRFEFGRGRFVIVTEPLELVAKMDELFSPQRRAVVAAKRAACHVHGRGQPVAIPVVGLVRMLACEHVDSQVLRIVVANTKRTAHLLRERLAVWVVAPAENQAPSQKGRQQVSGRRPKLQLAGGKGVNAADLVFGACLLVGGGLLLLTLILDDIFGGLLGAIHLGFDLGGVSPTPMLLGFVAMFGIRGLLGVPGFGLGAGAATLVGVVAGLPGA